MFQDAVCLRAIQATCGGVAMGVILSLHFSFNVRLRNKCKTSPDRFSKLFVWTFFLFTMAITWAAVLFIFDWAIPNKDISLFDLIICGVCVLFPLIWAFHSKFIPNLLED